MGLVGSAPSVPRPLRRFGPARASRLRPRRLWRSLCRGLGRVSCRHDQRPDAGGNYIFLPVRLRPGLLCLPHDAVGVVHIAVAEDLVRRRLGEHDLGVHGIRLGDEGIDGIHWAIRSSRETIPGRLSRVFLLHVFGLAHSALLGEERGGGDAY